MSEEKKETAETPARSAPISRRDFTRMAALGAAAASTTVIAKTALAQPTDPCVPGYEDLTLDIITNPNDPCVYVGERCATFLTRVGAVKPGLTVDELVYGSFKDLVLELATAESVLDIQVMMFQLAFSIDAADQKRTAGPPISFGDLFVNDEDTMPRTGVEYEDWAGVYNACRAVRNKNALRRIFPLTFLQLRPNGHRNREREQIDALITPQPGQSQSDFRRLVGPVPYLELFIDDHKKPFTTGGVYNSDAYDQARLAFKRGLFAGIAPSYTNLGGNRKCWDEDAMPYPACTTKDNSYCATENDLPTTSTDWCED